MVWDLNRTCMEPDWVRPFNPVEVTVTSTGLKGRTQSGCMQVLFRSQKRLFRGESVNIIKFKLHEVWKISSINNNSKRFFFQRNWPLWGTVLFLLLVFHLQ